MAKRNQKGHEAAVTEIYNRTSSKNPRRINLEKICAKHKICRTIGRSLISTGNLKMQEDGRYKWTGDKNPSIPSVVEAAVAHSTEYKYGKKPIASVASTKAKKKTQRVGNRPTGASHKQNTIELAKKFAGHGEIDFAHKLMDTVK